MTNVFVIKLLKLFCFTKAFSDVPMGNISMSIVALRGKWEALYTFYASMYLLFGMCQSILCSMILRF